MHWNNWNGTVITSSLEIEDAICSVLNGAGESFGKIELEGSDYEVRWCLLEKEQVSIVMDIPD